jgi:hypothetical protein
MTRSHRSAHRMLWLVLALALGLGLAISLLWRAPAHAQVMAAISEVSP